MRLLALLLTTLTGFSGLVYEVTWQKYLATLLGSHSEATAAVLGIFLGGLALGYWLFGTLTRRMVVSAEESGKPPRLLWTYGLLEAGIGLYAFFFPFFFKAVHAISYAIPHGAGGFGFAFDVILAALLIGPPTVLMGATIPILTQALAHDLDDATRFHAFVYGFNTVGAFFGALAAGFYLIPALGLIRVMFAMGVVNLVVGGVFLWIGRGKRTQILRATGEAVLPPTVFATYAAVALLTGFAMMAVQTTVIRVGALAFGSSEHTFAMVVAAFVLCIAAGSFAVSIIGRIPHVVLPSVLFGLVVLLCGLYSFLPEAPYWIHVVRTWFGDDPSDFYPYHFLGFCAVLLVIAPSVLFSGAVLPLVFDHLRHQLDDLGEVAGKLYSWNTLGSLLGALLGGYVLFFWLDLDQIFRLAVVAIAIAAVVLCLALYGGARTAVAAIAVALVSLPMVSSKWDPRLMTAGLFRRREPVAFTGMGADAIIEMGWKARGAELLFHEDDPIMTVTVMEQGKGASRTRSIVNNGKSDGSTIRDLPTMVLAATLPALYADKVERAFVIGYGTGITVGELASFESLKEVIVAEISPGVIHAAPLFDDVNYGASNHPKVEIVRSDAHRALMRSEGGFDVIVSEPSNPWVTGVEMLFSLEYLSAAAGRLNEGGVFAQWIQEYEIDGKTIEMVLRTFLAVFEEVSVWRTDTDLILLGSKKPFSQHSLDRIERRMKQPDYSASLRRVGIDSLPALLVHEVLPSGVLHATGLEGPLHTLGHPRLSHQAGLAFFKGGRGELPFTGFGKPAEIGAKGALLNRLAARTGGRLSETDRTQAVRRACATRPPLCLPMLAAWYSEAPESPNLQQLLGQLGQVNRDSYMKTISELMPLVAKSAAQPSATVPLAFARLATQHYRNFYQHLTPFRPQSLGDLWRRCQAPPNRPQACALGGAQAALLVQRGRMQPAEAPVSP
jgi:spermidine synthase